jgi:hypothetical protein
LIPVVVAEIEDICITNNWQYRILGEERQKITELSEKAGKLKGMLLDKISSLDIDGISFKPHEESENMQFIFDKEGTLKSVFTAMLGVSEKKKLDWLFCKTQFAGAEAHIKIINLLVYLKKKYFKKLEITDEGGYYPDNNIEALNTRMDFIDNAINTVQDIFENGEFKDKTPDQMLEQIQDAISRSFKGIKVHIMKIDASELFSEKLNKKRKRKKKQDENDEEINDKNEE